MSTPTIGAILTTALNTLGYDIAPENTEYTPVKNEIYLIENLISDISQHRAIKGGIRNNRTGLYQVTVMAPKGGTKFPARKAVEQIEALFFAGFRSSKDGVTVAIQQTTVSAALDEGDRFAVPITIEYTATGA